MALEIPRFLQTKQYSAKALRAAFLDGPLQAGVYGAADLKVAQRAAGANMSVEVPVGAAWVRGSNTARQGLYNVYNDATVNPAISANASGNPRVDQIILRVYDSVDGAAAQDLATIEVITGTGTAGAQITNPAAANYRAGAAALPSSSLLLADVLVANGAASIVTANIVDRRPWARGAYRRILRTSTPMTTSSTTFALIDATNLQPRIECSGNPMRVSLRGRHSNNGANFNAYNLYMDGTPVETGSTDMFTFPRPVNSPETLHLAWDIQPAAGTHQFGFAWRVTAGTATLEAAAITPLQMIVEELILQNASND